MIERFWIEAGKYDVLPVDDRMAAILDRSHKPGTPTSRKHFEYFPPVSRVTSYAAPPLGVRSWTLTADVERADSAVEGVIVGVAGYTRSYGMSLYVKEGHVVFDYNIFGDHHRVASESEVPEGRSTLEVRFDRVDRGAQATVLIDDEPAGTVQIPRILSGFGGGMAIGRDMVSPVARDDYEAPFPFSGRIRRVVFDIGDAPAPASPKSKPAVSWRFIPR